MPHLDLIFSLVGKAVPQHHSYPLYAAIAGVVPAFHSAKDVGIFSIRGTSSASGTLLLGERSVLDLRLPDYRITEALKLSGKALNLAGHRVRIGVPHALPLAPATTLCAGLILIKLAHAPEHGITPQRFLDSVRKKLNELGIAGSPSIPAVRVGAHAGEPRRKILKVKDQTHVGYELIVGGLTPEGSVLLQERGMGGRRLMGCGLFLPVLEEGKKHV